MKRVAVASVTIYAVLSRVAVAFASDPFNWGPDGPNGSTQMFGGIPSPGTHGVFGDAVVSGLVQFMGSSLVKIPMMVGLGLAVAVYLVNLALHLMRGPSGAPSGAGKPKGG